MPTREAPSNVDTSHPRKKRRWLLAASVTTLIATAQCGIALWLLPSSEQVAEAARTEVSKDQQSALDEIEELLVTSDQTQTIEIELGEFQISTYRPASNLTLHTDFVLSGVVRESDQSEFESRIDALEHRFRDRVITIVRNSEVADLSDAHLALIRRRILETSNALFGKRLLREVNFSEFRLFEE